MEDGGWPGSAAPSSILHPRSSKTGVLFHQRCDLLLDLLGSLLWCDLAIPDLCCDLANNIVNLGAVLIAGPGMPIVELIGKFAHMFGRGLGPGVEGLFIDRHLPVFLAHKGLPIGQKVFDELPARLGYLA